MQKTITETEYKALDKAYRFFNRELFAGELPECLITLNRRKGARGYFWGEVFEKREGEKVADELALNPDTFRGRTDREILSTMVHEQAHAWQKHFGAPSRNGYHNREWAEKMEAVGLMPSDTGEQGGKKTGQKMTHYIINGGAFDHAFAKLARTGWRLEWNSRAAESAKEKKARKARNKVKYSCPDCGANVWGKPGMAIICGDCDVPFESDE